jgi:hypothetical protein
MESYAFVQMRTFALKVVEHTQFLSPSHAFGTGGSELNEGIRKVSLISNQEFHEVANKTGCYK